MYNTVMSYGARFKPGTEDYHMPPFYGGDSAPVWECPTKNGKPNLAWHDHVMAEMDNTINNAGIESCIYAKVDIRGRKATEFVNKISTRNVPKKIGQCRLAYVCKTDGQVMNDISISTRSEDNLYIIGLGGWGKWEMDLLESLREELGYTPAQVQLTNVSHDIELIHVMGPKSNEILTKVLGPQVTDMEFMHFGQPTVDGMKFEVQRMSYSGLPGFELHIPAEYAETIYKRLMDDPFSRAASLKPHGACAVQGLRTEMWYRGSADVKNIGHYSEVMIDKFIYKKKSFHGMDPAYKPKKQVVMLDVDTPKGWEWGLHTGKYKVFKNGEEVGTTLSSAYGGRSRKVHAFAFLDAPVVGDGEKFSIKCHGQEFPATQMAEPVVPFTGKDPPTKS
jgi:glycine cleavage system aminomethyltransferase T